MRLALGDVRRRDLLQMNRGEHTRQLGLGHILDRLLERLVIVAQLCGEVVETNMGIHHICTCGV